MQPALDTESVLAMIEAVAGSVAIDRSRILVTGLSDGGTFSYLIGLNHPDSFRACAPIAGVLSPAVDPLLREHRGVNLPFHVVHGVHDAIFPVQTIRSTNDLLESLGYQLTYTELPDWGHALTYSINENIVLPWFEGIAGDPA
jgi:phospholipase/carboxylesterase